MGAPRHLGGYVLQSLYPEVRIILESATPRLTIWRRRLIQLASRSLILSLLWFERLGKRRLLIVAPNEDQIGNDHTISP